MLKLDSFLLMSVALKAVAWAWRFTQAEDDSPVSYTPESQDSPVS